ncbi:MAG: caspase family protein [Magnetococcales bacterium]|nr:caspase family protein [Magnetococcales bacterium]
MKVWRCVAFVLGLVVAVLAVPVEASEAPATRRVALVIGNWHYTNSPLFNPEHDAQGMSDSLKRLGFDVIYRTNVDKKGFRQAVRAFGDAIRGAGVGLFYYAGHGIQVNGQNYLIPVGADIQRQDEVIDEAIAANLVLRKMERAKNRLNIVMLDACRDNPFTRSWRTRGGRGPGLAQMDAPSGTIISYSTSPGSVASDGTGKNSPYTKHLLHNMKVPGLAIEQLFKRVRIGVDEETAGRQTPWESSSLKGDFFFTPGSQGSHAPASASSIGPFSDEREAQESLDGRIARLSQALMKSARNRSVYVHPIVESTQRYASDFSRYLTLRIKTFMVNSRSVTVMDGSQLLALLARHQQESSVQRVLGSGGRIDEASLLGADLLLDGIYFVNDTSVDVTLSLKTLSGETVTTIDESFPKARITMPLDNAELKTVARIADTVQQSGDADVVHLSTTRGGRHPVYLEGETIQFMTRVTRPLFIYLYGYNAKGEVVRLYPGDGEQQVPLRPGRVHRTPDDDDSWEIGVTPPFGTDTVKLFASTQALPVPRLDQTVASKRIETVGQGVSRTRAIKPSPLSKRINPVDLVDYFREQARRLDAELFEDSVVVETRKL